MTMTDTEAKALALVSIDPKALEHACLCAGRSVHHFDRMGDDLPLRASIVAHARAIERLVAFRQEVSDALDAFSDSEDWSLHPSLWRFILPKPVDPLVEAMVGAWPQYADRMEACNNDAKALCAAIEARGGKIVWEAGE